MSAQQPSGAEDAPYPVRVVAGQRCTTRAGMVVLLGRSLTTINHLAVSDPQFPRPVGGRRFARQWWYPLPAVASYQSVVAARAQQRRPRPAEAGGDPDDLVGVAGLAAIWHIADSTAYRYAYRARPQWTERRPRALVPVPDAGFDPDHPQASTWHDWRWARRTLAEHPRPGSTVGGRRPAT